MSRSVTLRRLGSVVRRAARQVVPLVTACAVMFGVYGTGHPVLPAMAADAIGGVEIGDRAGVTAQGPVLAAPAGILVSSDGRELWSRNADERRAMASTTKIMTAVLAVEMSAPDDMVTVSRDAVAVGESAAGLRAGDTLRMSELLKAVLVKSGNEAAVAVADHVFGSESAFVSAMNARAADLGLTETSFANPHGLDAEQHHTSARDLATLARYAMRLDEFRSLVGSRSVEVQTSRGIVNLTNSNELIGSYEGANGIKTGWTNRAGYCLVASAQRDGIELVAVVLGARSEQDRADQARTLLDWGFEHYRMETLASAEETAGIVPVSDYLDVGVGTILAEDAVAPVFDHDGEIRRVISVPESVDAPIERGQRIGTLTIAQGDRMLVQVPLVAAWSVERPGLFEGAWIVLVRLWRGLFGEPAPAGG